MHHLGRKLAKITEFCVRVCHESLRIVDHGFNGCVGPVSCCMVNVDRLQLEVVWADVPGAESHYILSYVVNFWFLNFFGNLVGLFTHTCQRSIFFC